MPQSNEPASLEPQLPRVVFPDGYAVHVEIAADDQTRAQGLMYRDSLRPQAGMLFFFPATGVYPFWMKNTLIPLDIIWIDEQFRIARVLGNVEPCRADPCPSVDPGVPARYVLEVAGGVAMQHQLAPGNVLRFEGVESVIVR
jgi:uncharacterized membrane protein (UPF0127 family)